MIPGHGQLELPAERGEDAAVRHVVILAGGGGTRLWPASRPWRPKQLLALGPQRAQGTPGGTAHGTPGETLLGATLRRVAGLDTLIVTAREFAAETALVAPGARLLCEPAARNTAAAVGWAATVLAAQDPDAVLAVLPADHHVADEAGFRATVDRALALAEQSDAIVTVGIRPTRPETGFGWLELGEIVRDGGARDVVRFVEKPDLATAQAFAASGRHLWNAGMFFFRAARILAELERCLPALAAGLRELAAGASPDTVYPTLPSISLDHGVMERTPGLLTLTGDFGWSDVGAWPQLAELHAADEQGNVVAAGRLMALDARDNLVYTDDGTLIALIGVAGLVVVRSGDAVLVVPRVRAQDVKELVRLLDAADPRGQPAKEPR
ncbi:MAG: mannose-6-phosphate isomerase [Myxococcales bacterium]|nr:mannose-6-phosphate isomerase [Myxococcales bacterium]